MKPVADQPGPLFFLSCKNSLTRCLTYLHTACDHPCGFYGSCNCDGQCICDNGYHVSTVTSDCVPGMFFFALFMAQYPGFLWRVGGGGGGGWGWLQP